MLLVHLLRQQTIRNSSSLRTRLSCSYSMLWMTRNVWTSCALLLRRRFRSPEPWHGRRSRSPQLNGSYGWGASLCSVIVRSISVAFSWSASFRRFRQIRLTGESESGHQSCTYGCVCCEKRDGAISMLSRNESSPFARHSEQSNQHFWKKPRLARMCGRPGNLWRNTISHGPLRFWAPTWAKAQSMATMTFDSSSKRNSTEQLARRLAGNWSN